MDNKTLPLPRFQKLLRAIYGEAPKPRVNLGFGPTHDPDAYGIIAEENGSLVSFWEEVHEAVREDVGEMILADVERDRLAVWMDDTAERVREARKAGLTDDTPGHVVESVLHGDETAEAIYGRRLVLEAVEAVKDGRRYVRGGDGWMPEGAGGFAGC